MLSVFLRFHDGCALKRVSTEGGNSHMHQGRANARISSNGGRLSRAHIFASKVCTTPEAHRPASGVHVTSDGKKSDSATIRATNSVWPNWHAVHSTSNAVSFPRDWLRSSSGSASFDSPSCARRNTSRQQQYERTIRRLHQTYANKLVDFKTQGETFQGEQGACEREDARANQQATTCCENCGRLSGSRTGAEKVGGSSWC